MSKLDKENVKNSLFGNIRHVAETEQKESTTTHKDTLNIDPPIEPSSKPKWKELEKITVLMTEEQKLFLDRTARNLMRHRSKGGKTHKERITANTILRCLLQVFMEKENTFTIEDLYTEEEVLDWVNNIF